MSILGFLRVIDLNVRAASGGSSRPRPRRLGMEALEGRAMLTLEGDLLLEPEGSEAPADETAPILAEPIGDGSTSSTDSTSDSGLPADPIEEERDFLQPPVIDPFGCERMGDWVSVGGVVTDDGPVEGLTVYCSTDTGVSFTVTVGADGSFQSPSYVIPYGSQISAYTIDVDGNESEVVMCFA